MVAQTGCDGVVVGRGCQGRPWLFADLAAAFAGSDERIRPGLGYVATIVRRHAELMVEHFGDEGKALREMRKHMAWYFKGYSSAARPAPPSAWSRRWPSSTSVLAASTPTSATREPVPRARAGRAGSPKRPLLPDGWLCQPGTERRTTRR